MTENKPTRLWLAWFILPLCLAGAWIGVFMTQHHEVQLYGSEQDQAGHLWGCQESELVNCDLVNTSDWSELFGVPQFTWAIPTYLAMGLLAGLLATGRRQYGPYLFAMGTWCALYSVFLGYISYVELGYICLWCTRLYGINFVIPLLAWFSGGVSRPFEVQAGSVFAGVFLVAAVGSIGWQQAYRADLLEGTPALTALPADDEVPPPDAHTAGDAQGPCPARSFEVTTEDGNTGTVTTHPDDPWKGNPDAVVTVIEYADFECGYCKRATGQMARLYEAYKDRVLFVYKNYAMDPACNPGVNNKKHRYACEAALAGECARAQGRFWPMHDLMFKNQHQLRSTHLISYAETVGVDVDAFKTCMREKTWADAVAADGAAGKALDIHGTPRIWINEKLYRSGSSAEQMARAIEVALGTPAAQASSNASELKVTRDPVRPIPDDISEMQALEMDGLKFSIDTFEAALSDGEATSGKHQIPGTNMSWYAANDACEAAGKRMCTEEEWVSACQGVRAVDDDHNRQFADDLIEGNTYPYGDYHEPGRCWESKDHTTFRPVYTGEMPACVTKAAVYDLTGNVEEWVGDSAETAVLLGGAYNTDKDHARCYRRNDTFGAGYASMRTGFRCCSNAE